MAGNPGFTADRQGEIGDIFHHSDSMTKFFSLIFFLFIIFIHKKPLQLC